MEYVTDPVLRPGLRCPHCSGTVRQIRQFNDESGAWVGFVAEPIAWAMAGGAALFGVLTEAVFALTFALLFGGPILAAVLYVRSLRRSEFLCTRCGEQSSYGKVVGK